MTVIYVADTHYENTDPDPTFTETIIKAFCLVLLDLDLYSFFSDLTIFKNADIGSKGPKMRILTNQALHCNTDVFNY